jgi:hypothetical protein
MMNTDESNVMSMDSQFAACSLSSKEQEQEQKQKFEQDIINTINIGIKSAAVQFTFTIPYTFMSRLEDFLNCEIITDSNLNYNYNLICDKNPFDNTYINVTFHRIEN